MSLPLLFLDPKTSERVVIEDAPSIPRVGDELDFGHGDYDVVSVLFKIESGAMHHVLIEVRPKDEDGHHSMGGTRPPVPT